MNTQHAWKNGQFPSGQNLVGFALLLPGVSALSAQAIATDICDRFETAGASAHFTMPTAGYVIIPIAEDSVLVLADQRRYSWHEAARLQEEALQLARTGHVRH